MAWVCKCGGEIHFVVTVVYELEDDELMGDYLDEIDRILRCQECDRVYEDLEKEGAKWEKDEERP